MAIQKLIDDVSPYFKWGITLKQQLMELLKNMYYATSNILSSTKLWQPETNYAQNSVIMSPSLPPNCVAVVTKAGTSGKNEPTWGAVDSVVTDGTVQYKIQYRILTRATSDDVNKGTDVYKYITAKIIKPFLDKKLDISTVTPNYLLKIARSYGDNYEPSDTSNSGWFNLGLCTIYYNKEVINNQPSDKGHLINVPGDSAGKSLFQFFISSSYDNFIYYRCTPYIKHPNSHYDSIDSMPFSRCVSLAEFEDTKSDYEKKYNNLVDAYKKLRLQSYPTSLDDSELTLLASNIHSGTITLTKPYTDFDGLYVVIQNDNGVYTHSKFISTDEINRRRSYGQSWGLFEGDYYWYLRKDSTDTILYNATENCIINQLYGVKFNTDIGTEE